MRLTHSSPLIALARGVRFSLLLCASLAAAAETRFFISSAPDSDLVQAMKSAGLELACYDAPASAISNATPGSAVLLLAREYPDKALSVPQEAWAEANAKNLRVYVEFCETIPGLSFAPVRKTPWERFVISSDKLGVELPKLRLLVAHDAHVLPATNSQPWMVVARVAGYNRAVFGIPASAQSVLFPHGDGRTLVATTRLSDFRKGRFTPAAEWEALWTLILKNLSGQELPRLRWEPRVTAMYGPEDALPVEVERQGLANAAAWHFKSRLLVAESQKQIVRNLMLQGAELWDVNPSDLPVGDGTIGILEGYASNIRVNGNQPLRSVIRADCQAESAMVLALDGAQNSNRLSSAVASNLLDFLFFTSDMCKGVRGDPNHPAFGLISWGSTTPAWMVANYGDDNARVMLGTMLAGAALESERYEKPLLRALLANLRTTGNLGFRGDRIDIPQLEQNGWRHYYDAATVNYSPHFESYNWACFLWAYKQTGYREFLDRAKTGIGMMMQAYPDQWRWDDNTERGRMLLCLAWLVQLENTDEHRGWLKRIVDDFMAIQHTSGALPERFRGAREGSHYQVPASNEAYGTTETPLIQENGDPVSDQLYLSGFALLGLHEAAAVLNDPRVKAMEDRLAEYLCRIQIKSKELPFLEGTWFRAFDFVRWEAWASSGDAGWGAWCVEAGWAQAWTAATLGLRAQNTTLWDVTSSTHISQHMNAVQNEMSVNKGGPWDGSGGTEPPSAKSQTAYSKVVSNDAPILYWDFDETSGNALEVMPVLLASTANDLAPVANATRISHTAMGSGLNLGNAASFQAGDYFVVQDLTANMNRIEGPWAIELWMRAQGSMAVQRNNYLINFGDGGGNVPAVLYDYAGAAQPRGGLEMFSGGNRTGAGPVINDLNWHHVLFVFYGNGTAGVADRLDIYLDGTNAAQNVRSTFSSALTLARLVVGTSAPQFAGLDGFEGELDEIAIYDLTRVGTEAAVTASMSQMASNHFALAKTTQTYAQAVLADQPLFYWNFDEENGNARQLASTTLPSARNDLVPLGGASRFDHSANLSGLGLGQAAHIPEGGYFAISQLTTPNPIIPAPYLIEFWIQAQGNLTTHPRNDYLMNLANNAPSILYDYNGANPNGGIELYGAGTRTGFGPGIVDPGWHHIVFACYGNGASGVGDRLDIYMDGTNAAQNVRGTFTSPLTLTSLVFGSSGGQFAVADGFEGNLDELAFYDLASLQTEADVTQKASGVAANHFAAAQELALSVTRSGASLVFSWNALATGYSLESNTDVRAGSWTPVPETAIFVNGKARVTVTPNGPSKFFRLKR